MDRVFANDLLARGLHDGCRRSLKGLQVPGPSIGLILGHLSPFITVVGNSLTVGSQVSS